MTNHNSSVFDIVIGGGGASGLSLAYFLSQGGLNGKKVLIIEADQKNSNDRTWTSWVSKDDVFNHLASKQWGSLDVYNKETHVGFDMSTYVYRMIRSADFYAHMHEEIDSNSSIERINARILDHQETSSELVIRTSHGEFKAKHYYPSFVVADVKERSTLYLDQHFKGWFISTSKEVFDDRRATLMDFRIEDGRDTRFMYVLPLSKKEALVEVAIFSNDILKSKEYDAIISDYLKEYWELSDRDYHIEEEELGVIPMNDYKYQSHNTQRVTFIGGAGGSVKASSGYAFSRIVESMQELASTILKGNPNPKVIHSSKKYRKYDQTLLNILSEKPELSGKIFVDLFDRNDPELVLKFLDEKTSLAEEIKIMSSTDISLFLPSFIGVLGK